MFRKLKNGIAHVFDITGNKDEVRYETLCYATSLSISTQESKTIVFTPEVDSDAKKAAVAEIIITEMAYYRYLINAARFMAVSGSDEDVLSSINTIQHDFVYLCQELEIPTQLLILAISEEANEETRRSAYRTLVSNLYYSSNSTFELRKVNCILQQLCQISEKVWNLMTFFSMTDAFQYLSLHPHFKTLEIYPLDSIFGNNGWKIPSCDDE